MNSMPKRLMLWFVFAWMFPCFAYAIWVWMSPEQYIESSTLIAVLNVGEIHRAVTPEGISVQSAKATVEKVVYYQFEEEEKLPETVVVWTVDADQTSCNLPLCTGRVFAMLQGKGLNKFIPYDRLSLQLLGPEEKIYWPTKKGQTEQVSLSRVINELLKIKEKRKQAP